MTHINIKINSKITKPKKGTKILKLKPCIAENSLRTYKNNSHIIGVYKFYSSYGYKPYSSITAFKEDFIRNSDVCIVCTFMTVYDSLKHCSSYPFINCKNVYYYSCLEEQDSIEEIIEETYYKVFQELDNTLDLNRLHSIPQLKAYIINGIKQKAHLDRCIKKFNITKTYTIETMEYLVNSHNIEGQYTEYEYIKNKTQEEIKTTLQEYLNTKDKIDTLIIVTNLMRYGIPYGETEGHRHSLNHIANLCNISERAVKARKQKLIPDLKILCKSEVLPLMIS